MSCQGLVGWVREKERQTGRQTDRQTDGLAHKGTDRGRPTHMILYAITICVGAHTYIHTYM